MKIEHYWFTAKKNSNDHFFNAVDISTFELNGKASMRHDPKNFVWQEETNNELSKKYFNIFEQIMELLYNFNPTYFADYISRNKQLFSRIIHFDTIQIVINKFNKLSNNTFVNKTTKLLPSTLSQNKKSLNQMGNEAMSMDYTDQGQQTEADFYQNQLSINAMENQDQSSTALQSNEQVMSDDDTLPPANPYFGQKSFHSTNSKEGI